MVKSEYNTPIGQYVYDGNGKRIKKITASEYVVFVYDGLGKLIGEYSADGPPQAPMVQYTATDTLGSPRVLTNELGEVVSRRDFMPFGEEVAADQTYRTAAHKYGVGDGVRQKFTGYERDDETGLDFAEARYYYNNHGRFTAVDPLLASGRSADPQTFNRYAYVMNRPLILTDSTGLDPCASAGNGADHCNQESQERARVTPPAWLIEYAGQRTVTTYEHLSDGTRIEIGTITLSSAEVANRIALATDAYNEAFHLGIQVAQESVGDNISVDSTQSSVGSQENQTTTESAPEAKLAEKPELRVPLGPTESRGSGENRAGAVTYNIVETSAVRAAAATNIAAQSQSTINQEGGRTRLVTTYEGARVRARVNTAEGVREIVSVAARAGANEAYISYMASRRALSQP